MGQKASSIALRLKYTRGWDANWFADKRTFAQNLLQDQAIRRYVLARMPHADITRIVVERTSKKITLVVHTAKPGVVIGKSGVEIEKLPIELKKLYGKDIQIKVAEIKRPELSASLVAKSIAQQLRFKGSYKRLIRYTMVSAIRLGAEGIKIKLSGRINGIEIARSETYKEGRLPLNTLRADVDYALAEARTTYGNIGVKVWIFIKEVYGKRDLSLSLSSITDQGPSRYTKPSVPSPLKGFHKKMP